MLVNNIWLKYVIEYMEESELNIIPKKARNPKCVELPFSKLTINNLPTNFWRKRDV